MRLGKQMQFFGARVNLAKALLYAINGGRDEVSRRPDRAADARRSPATCSTTTRCSQKFDHMMEWLARTYVHAMNCIHYMHDKYFYERLEMALHDRDILRTMAFGIAGLSVVADSLSAIKYAKVRAIRDETGLVVDYVIEATARSGPAVRQQRRPGGRHRGRSRDTLHAEDPQAPDLSQRDAHPVRADHHVQRRLRQGTGNTPDGRRKGEPFGPGANPMHGRDSHGWLASCLSVAKLPYQDALDGISYTVSVAPQNAQIPSEELVDAAVKAFDMYFGQGGFHMNLNVVDKETLAGRDEESRTNTRSSPSASPATR